MTWNYRLIRRTVMVGEVEESSYAVHEVHYDDTGCPRGWTQEPVSPSGDDFKEAYESYLLMADAFKNPPLRIEGDTLVIALE